MHLVPVLVLALLGALPGRPAVAAPEVPVLKDTVIARFNAEDQRLMRARVDEALKAPGDGVALTWRNDQTGAAGEVTPLDRQRWKNMDCRRLKVRNTYKSQVGQGVWRFCEKPKGTWKLVGPDGGVKGGRP